MAVSTLFDGTNDNIVSNTGNNLTLGAYTWGALLHLETIAGLDTWFSLDDGGTARFAPFTSGTTLGVEHATGTSATLANAFADWGGWRLVFITKATGTAAPRAHIFNGVSWAHNNLGTAIGNPNGAISLLWIGGYATGASDFSDGEVGWMGLWNEDTNDATCESYVDFSTLSSKSNAQFFTGTSLLAGGTMNDSGAGNNDETSRTGATTGVRDLPAWQTNFHTRSLPGVTAISEYVGTTGNPTEARPTGATTGDLVISVVGTDTNSTIAWSTGWTEIYNTANGTATRLGVAARVLTGGGDDTLAITLAGGSNTNDFACQELLIPAALHGVSSVASDIDLGTAATGTSATPDPPTVTVSSGDYLIVAMFAADDDDTSNAYMPASYAGLRQTRSTTGTSSCMIATAFAERTSTTSENPGTFTMAASEEWVAGTIAIPPAASGATGTVAVTLDAVTSTASGTETFTGTSAQTLANITSTASGWHTISGTSAQTLADVTSTASGTETITGTSAQTLADATSTASGAETFTGTSAQTLANVTSTASGWHTISGTSAQTLADVTSTASGTVVITGTSAQTLADATSTASGWTTITGTSGQTLADATSTASGALTISGTSAQTLADATSTASGWHTVTGTSAQTLANATSDASGTVGEPGEEITGSAAVTLAAFTSTASGAETFTGTSAQTLAAVTSTATGAVVITGSSSVTLAAFTSTASGTETITGSVTVTLTGVTSTATGALTITGTVAVTLEAFTALGQETVPDATSVRRALLVHRQPAVIVQRRPGIVEHQQPTTVVHRQPRANVHRRSPIT